jgi:hypothetical protein
MISPLLTVHQDTRDLVPWAAPNQQALDDDLVLGLCLQALGGPLPDELLDPVTHQPLPVPVVRYPDPSWPVVPLLEVLASGVPITTTTTCDRCAAGDNITDLLLIVFGYSVVFLWFCTGCRGQLDASFPSLVWEC